MTREMIVAILAKRITDEKDKPDGMNLTDVPLEYREYVEKLLAPKS